MSPTPVIQVTAGAELPDQTLTWQASDGTVIDFSSGHTFTMRIDTDPVTIKSAGIVGAATSPNITLQFAANELDTFASGIYGAQLVARRTSDSKDRVMPLRFVVHRAI